MLGVASAVDGGVEAAEFGVGEEVGEVSVAGRTAETEGAAGYFGGFDEGVIVDPVAAGGVHQLSDESFTHRPTLTHWEARQEKWAG